MTFSKGKGNPPPSSSPHGGLASMHPERAGAKRRRDQGLGDRHQPARRLRRASGRRVALGAVVVMTFAAAACHTNTRTAAPRIVRGASPNLGKQLIVKYGCGSCHEIPGIKGASGLVGPPLVHFGRRGTIAGELANTPDNLTTWIHDPHSVEPGTDMPNLGISRQQARNIAAYLFELR